MFLGFAVPSQQVAPLAGVTANATAKVSRTHALVHQVPLEIALVLVLALVALEALEPVIHENHELLYKQKSTMKIRQRRDSEVAEALVIQGTKKRSKDENRLKSFIVQTSRYVRYILKFPTDS